MSSVAPEPALARASPFMQRLSALFVPARLTTLYVPLGVEPSLIRQCEQLLTALMRIGVVLGMLVAALAARGMIDHGRSVQLLIVILFLGLVAMLSLRRQIDYRLRCGLWLFSLYGLAITELIYLGFASSVQVYLATFTLGTAIFLSYNPRLSIGALALSVVTLIGGNALAFAGYFVPLAGPPLATTVAQIFVRGLIFLLAVGTCQIGIAILLHQLRASWWREHLAREELELRVTERTSELAAAHAQALALSQQEARQKEYLAALQQTTLELLGARDVDALLSTIIERAGAILRTPWVLLALEEQGELILKTFTPGYPLTVGMHVPLEARITRQCFTSRQPVVIENYSALEGRLPIYNALDPGAVADIPILAGARCLGVLGMMRSRQQPPFTPAEVEQTMAFAQLIAMVIDNAHLYDMAQRELAERERAEAALQRYANQLESQNSELDAFAHTVAHDLKNPLTGLIGYSELLQNNYALFDEAQVMGFLNDITRMGHKMTHIINELLFFANIRAQTDVPVSILAMDTIMFDVELRMQPQLQRSQATLVQAECWPAALGYAPWVEEVWMNYISNAIKYGGSPPYVVLGATQQADGQIRFWVDDNGDGLALEDRAWLFAPFIRLRGEHADGHGLGLSIVQRIITRLGGVVGVEDAPGQGCRFFFTLPAAPAQPAPTG